MTISILTDNSPGGNTLAEHGLSYLIEHAKKVTGENTIYGVMGGFHLKKATTRLY